MGDTVLILVVIIACCCVLVSGALVVFKDKTCGVVKIPILCSIATAGPDSSTKNTTALKSVVLTNFTYENNTPCNSMNSASGKPLTPYISVAVQFRFLKKFGGPYDFGDFLFVKFLEGRVMPNGIKHTGWVRIDTFCGDSGDDSYCFQDVNGKKYPVVDLYIGSFPSSGQKCDGKGSVSGPGGSGQEVTEVTKGTPPAGKFKTSYGGKAKGPGKCNDCVGACVLQSGLSAAACRAEIAKGDNRTPDKAFENKCWWYVPAYGTEEQSWCTAANSTGGGVAKGGL